MGKFDIYMRYGYGVADWKKPILKPKYLPLVYKVPLKESKYVRTKLGLIKTIRMWFIERKLVRR